MGIRPAPSPEFLVRSLDLHIVICSQKAHQEPYLPLTTITPAPHLAHQLGRQIIDMFTKRARDDINQLRSYSRFFPQLSNRRSFRRLSRVNSALRHLPRITLAIESLADKDAHILVDQHNAGTWAVRQVIE